MIQIVARWYFQVLDWLKRAWVRARSEFLIQRPHIKFGSGAYWRAYPENKSIRLTIRNEGPNIDFEIRAFKFFLQKCKTCVDLKRKTKFYKYNNLEFTIDANFDDYILFEISQQYELISREIVVFYEKIENKKFFEMVDMLGTMLNITIDMIAEIESRKL